MDIYGIGKKGEDAAAEFLEESGCRVLRRNYRVREGEIDIIAKKGGVTVFAEVKTRADEYWGAASEAVDGEKQSRFMKAVGVYLREHENCAAEINIIEVYPEGKGFRVKLIENAF